MWSKDLIELSNIDYKNKGGAKMSPLFDVCHHNSFASSAPWRDEILNNVL
jgi:tRNA U34 5-methylaminomethyl-2-thiouridine-forming methyltransferase MnmC